MAHLTVYVSLRCTLNDMWLANIEAAPVFEPKGYSRRIRTRKSKSKYIIKRAHTITTIIKLQFGSA